MPAASRVSPPAFDPAAYDTFRFVASELTPEGVVLLDYALGDALSFREEIRLPTRGPLSPGDIAAAAPLVALLHLVAGVSYYKIAAPPRVSLDAGPPPAPVALLLEALYSEGLGEFAYENRLDALPGPRFGPAGEDRVAASAPAPDAPRALVPLGGGKDSVVAVEVLRAAGHPFDLFAVGDATPIVATATAAGAPLLVARRVLDQQLRDLNAAGALNGHVPVTAVVSLIGLLTARLHGHDRVVMANERSASEGNLRWHGTEINHQFSKGLPAERLLRAALADVAPGLEYFSVLRPASELGIARTFARFTQYHAAFTSCNAVFRIDEERRAQNWCTRCPKCRFVFLCLAPFLPPEQLVTIFGRNLLEEEDQFADFALLAAFEGHKPFECVGEEREAVAAFRLLAEDRRWRDAAIVARFASDVLTTLPDDVGRPEDVLALSEDHEVPPDLLPAVRALL